MPWWEIFIIYWTVGVARSAYLLGASRIEGDIHELIFHTTLWPLEALEWLERKYITRR